MALKDGERRMGIYAFAASIFFLVVVARAKGIRILSPYGIFALFQILYNVTPWFMIQQDVSQNLFKLLSDVQLVNLQLWLACSGNLCFGLVHLFLYRKVAFSSSDRTHSPNRRRRYFYLAFPLFLITCILCEQYGWHAYTYAQHMGPGESPGGIYTATAYVKYFFVAIYLYYISKYGLDKWSWLLFGEHIVVMVVDGGRTTFMPIMLLTLMIFVEQFKDKKKIRRIYIGAIAGILLSIGTRALILAGDSVFQKMLIPVAIEGSMGDYPSLQSLRAIQSLFHPNYTFGASYIIDPLIWLLPQGMRVGSFFDGWISHISPTLPDTFAPMGGFYYISEALAAYSFAGPAIVTTIFALTLVWFERNKNNHRMLYAAWISTIGFLFVKMIFANCFKLFLINLIFMGLIEAASKIRLLYIRIQPVVASTAAARV